MKLDLDSESLFIEGLRFYENDDFRLALANFNQVLKIDPNHYKSWYYKGAVLTEYEKYEQAIESYQRFLDITSSLDGLNKDEEMLYKALLQCGRNYALVNNHEEAIDKFNDAIEVTSNDEEVWLARGRSFYVQRNFVEATNSYEEALSLSHDNYICWHYKGELAYQMNSFEYAIFCWKKVLNLNPIDHYLLIEEGNLLLAIGEYEVALECFERALESSSIDYEALLKKGICLMKLRQRHLDITNAFRGCLKLEPENPLGWYWEGEWLFSLAMYSQAIPSFDKAINLSPNFEAAWLRRSEILQKLGFYQAAIDSNNALIAISRMDWEMLGIISFRAECYQGALTIFEEILKQRPSDCGIWTYKMQSLKYLGRIQDAKNSINQAQKLGCQISMQNSAT